MNPPELWFAYAPVRVTRSIKTLASNHVNAACSQISRRLLSQRASSKVFRLSRAANLIAAEPCPANRRVTRSCAQFTF